MRSGITPCGLRYAVRRSGHSVAYCALTIGCGTRDEAGYPAGIAHFVEHTLFRGTRRKSASVISSYLDRLGGELNAYTTKEEIVLHATVLKEDLGKAARLLFELATEATFPEKEIETERGVVIDEIISYKDNPAEDVYDRFESLLFEGSPLSSPILGTRASVKKITPDMLRAFVAESSSRRTWPLPSWPTSRKRAWKRRSATSSPAHYRKGLEARSQMRRFATLYGQMHYRKGLKARSQMRRFATLYGQMHLGACFQHLTLFLHLTRLWISGTMRRMRWWEAGRRRCMRCRTGWCVPCWLMFWAGRRAIRC